MRRLLFWLAVANYGLAVYFTGRRQLWPALATGLNYLTLKAMWWVHRSEERARPGTEAGK